MVKRLVLICCLLLPMTSWAGKPWVGDDTWTTRYDHYFRKYAKHYFGPLVDWRWFKSQAIVESSLRPGVESGAGARGLMQIMPRTWRYEIKAENTWFGSFDTPRWNIAGGIWYDRYLLSRVQVHWDDLPSMQQLYFMFGAYNAGLTGILRAYNRATPPPDSWPPVAEQAPRQTRIYVERIVEVKTNRPPAWKRNQVADKGAAGLLPKAHNRSEEAPSVRRPFDLGALLSYWLNPQCLPLCPFSGGA